MHLRCAHCLSNAVTKLSPDTFECRHCGATGERIPKPAYVRRGTSEMRPPRGNDSPRRVTGSGT